MCHTHTCTGKDHHTYVKKKYLELEHSPASLDISGVEMALSPPPSSGGTRLSRQGMEEARVELGEAPSDRTNSRASSGELQRIHDHISH